MLLLLVGILLAVIAMPTAERSTSQKTSELLTGTGSRKEETTGKAAMEEQLAGLLSQVEGVGEVRVMLTVKGASKNLYGESVGEETVTGVLVAADGADDLKVVQNIQEAVQALFQVEPHKIKVMKMK